MASSEVRAGVAIGKGARKSSKPQTLVGKAWLAIKQFRARWRARSKLRKLKQAVPDSVGMFQPSEFVASEEAVPQRRGSSAVPITADPITMLFELAQIDRPNVRAENKHLVILEQTLRMDCDNPFSYIPGPVLAQALGQAQALEEFVGEGEVGGLHLLTLKIRRHLLECEQRERLEKSGGEVRWQPLRMPAAPVMPSKPVKVFDTTGSGIEHRDFEPTKPFSLDRDEVDSR
jgi:hypothetical protein